jgi:hypothetical protein
MVQPFCLGYFCNYECIFFSKIKLRYASCVLSSKRKLVYYLRNVYFGSFSLQKYLKLLYYFYKKNEICGIITFPYIYIKSKHMNFKLPRITYSFLGHFSTHIGSLVAQIVMDPWINNTEPEKSISCWYLD